MSIVLNVLLLTLVLIAYVVSGRGEQVGLDVCAWILFTLGAASMVTFLLLERVNRALCFELLFFPAFAVGTYSHPLLTAGLRGREMFARTSDAVVAKAMFVATAGVICYSIGASCVATTRRKRDKSKATANLVPTQQLLPKGTNALVSACGAIFVGIGGLALYQKYFGYLAPEAFVRITAVLSLLTQCLLISTVVEFWQLRRVGTTSVRAAMRRMSKHYALNVLAVSIFLFFSGDRGTFLQIALPVLFLYSLLIRKLKATQIAPLLGLCLLALIVVRDARIVDGGALRNFELPVDVSATSLVSDMLPANATLGILVDYADANGITYGKQALPRLLAAVPFLQSAVGYLVGVDFGAADYSSSLYVATGEIWPDLRSGLGTHIVGDLYYSFGGCGACLALFAFGCVVGWLDGKVFLASRVGFVPLFCYAYLFGYSVYAVRSEFFYPVRDIGFSLIIIWGMTALAALARTEHRRHVPLQGVHEARLPPPGRLPRRLSGRSGDFRPCESRLHGAQH